MIKNRVRIVFGILTMILAVLFYLVQRNLLHDVPTGWVEVSYNSNQSVLKEAVQKTELDMSGQVSWTGSTLTLTGANTFTAQQLRTCLLNAGLEENMLTIRDYAWSDKVLSQSRTICWMAGAFSIIVIFIRYISVLGRDEYHRMKSGCVNGYFSEYIAENCVRLMAELIILTAGCFISAALLKWLWQVELVMPAGFLPDGSIFDWRHYQTWYDTMFHMGSLSIEGSQLKEMLPKAYWLTFGTSASLLLAAIMIPDIKKRFLLQID